MSLHWTAFPLHPETPEEGQTLEDLFKGREKDIPEMMKRLKRVAEEEGLPLGERKKTFNSRLAHELEKWAEKAGHGDAYRNALFRAYFAHGTNIGKIDELILLAESLGLPGQEARRVLEKRAFRAAVDLDWERSRNLGITAVPTCLMENRMLVGAQPYHVLEAFVKERDKTGIRDKPDILGI